MSYGDMIMDEYEHLERAYFGREETINIETCVHCGEDVDEWEVINDDVTCLKCKKYNEEHE